MIDLLQTAIATSRVRREYDADWEDDRSEASGQRGPVHWFAVRKSRYNVLIKIYWYMVARADRFRSCSYVAELLWIQIIRRIYDVVF